MVALASTALFACEKPPERGTAPQSPPKSNSVIPPLPVVEPPMDREALLMAVIRAASATAGGKEDKDVQRLLDGKRFELRMRFGCDGAEKDGGAPRSWTFDEERRVLRIRVATDISADTPLLSKLGMGQIEAAEGFWITRPWLLTAGCPAKERASPVPPPATPDAAPASPPAADPSPSPPLPRLAIAQFFTASDSRTHRRERAYEVTRTLESGAEPGIQGFDLVVAGRLKRLDDHPVIACLNESTGQAPSCLISSEFERVTIEQPGTGETIADWAVR